jgi:hypothetical protein
MGGAFFPKGREDCMPQSRSLQALLPSLLLLFAFTLGLGQEQKKPLSLTIPDSLGKSLTVKSFPSNAGVWLNGTHVGMTPLSTTEIDYGTAIVLVRAEGYSSFSDTLTIRFGSHPRIMAHLRRPGILYVASSPPGAQVFVDGVLLGRTPHEERDVRAGEHRLNVHAEKHETWTSVIEVPEDSVVQITADLVQEHGTLDVSVTPADAVIEIEGETTAQGLLVGYKLSEGHYRIRLASPSSGTSAEQTVFVPVGGNVRIEARLDEKTYMPVLWSALVPGLGQLTSGSTIEGTVLLLGTVTLGGWAAYSASSYSSSLSAYDEARQKYLEESSSEDLLLEYRKNMQSAYDTAEKKYKMRNISLAVFGAFYLYTVIDAFLFHTQTVVLSVSEGKDPGSLGGSPVRLPDRFQLTLSLPF